MLTLLVLFEPENDYGYLGQIAFKCSINIKNVHVSAIVMNYNRNEKTSLVKFVNSNQMNMSEQFH